VIERFDSPNDSFDVVLRTLMMHHFPDDLKQQGLAEVAHVLKPNGRLIVVDFNRTQGATIWTAQCRQSRIEGFAYTDKRDWTLPDARRRNAIFRSS